jgi:hypothetical protein
MVLLASTYDQSKFLRAEDLTQDKTFRIKSVSEELVGQGADRQKKLVVWFTNNPKGLALNRTNNRTIRSAYGDDTAGWTGKLIVVFRTQADFRGRLVDALRVRIPPPRQQARPAVAESLNSFAAPSQPAAVRAAAKPAAEILPPEEDLELNDEIGF